MLTKKYYRELTGAVETPETDVENTDNTEKEVKKHSEGSVMIAIVFALGVVILVVTVLISIKLDQKKRLDLQEKRKKKRMKKE